MNTRYRVSVRRMADVFGILGGVLVYFIMDMSQAFGSGKPVMHYSAFFGPVDRWPTYMKTFGPADIAACALFAWLACRIFVEGMAMRDKTRNLWYWAKFGTGVFALFGAFSGVIAASTYGWYAGLEDFFVFGFWLSVFALGVCLLAFAIVGACSRAEFLARKLWQRVESEPLVQWFAQPLNRLGRYLEAEDIPSEPEP